MLEALAFAAQGDHQQALTSLERALSIAEPEGYVRIFVDEGDPMRQLLTDYQSDSRKRTANGLDGQSPYLLTYIDKLLSVFPQSASAQRSGDGAILEALSERELDILRLIAAGRSNQEIADNLVIALSTVKSHINNLYSKLGTNWRTEAIAMAREKGLLSK